MDTFPTTTTLHFRGMAITLMLIPLFLVIVFSQLHKEPVNNGGPHFTDVRVIKLHHSPSGIQPELTRRTVIHSIPTLPQEWCANREFDLTVCTDHEDGDQQGQVLVTPQASGRVPLL